MKIKKIYIIFLMFLLIGCNNIKSKKVALTFSYRPLSGVVLDFESGHKTKSEFTDISISVNEKGYIVAYPENGSSGIYLTTLNDMDNLNLSQIIETCVNQEEEFLVGHKPISADGDSFCWKSAEGNIIVFTINKVVFINGNVVVEIIYLIKN